MVSRRTGAAHIRGLEEAPEGRDPSARSGDWKPGRIGSNESFLSGQSDATMYHMTKATVRDLRYRFSKVEELLKGGEEIQITKRGRPIALLAPIRKRTSAKRPDFLGRLKRIYGDKVLPVAGAELLGEERGRY